MCGFAGFLTTAPYAADELSELARRMIAPIVHRGPDDSGVWTDEAAGVAFGFRRLAILDLSPLGHQPMHSASGRYVAVFNGEVYNFGGLRAGLGGGGGPLRGRPPTEGRPAAFER